MNGICRLCGQERDLQESHVIPSFVYKWLKETSGTGFLRFGMEPNKRVQDGYKFYWLCKECEGCFNEWETAFANQMFHPMNNGTVEHVSYDTWLLKFCTSVSWRVLNLFLEGNVISNFPENLQACALRTQDVWRNYLLDNSQNPSKNEQHFLPLDTIESFTHHSMPTNINRYILRSVDIDAVCGGESAFVYSKLGKFIIVGFIEMPYRNQWVGTKVHVKHGVVGPSSYTLPVQFWDYLTSKAEKADNIRGKISEKQNRKIKDSYGKDIDRVAKSESFRAMHQDVKLFGNKVFKQEK